MIAEIAVSGTAYSFDMLFSYRIPQDMELKRGCRVLVPFGRGNRRRVGVAMGFTEGDEKSLKPVAALIDSEPVLNEEQLKLAEFLHDRTFCTWYDGIKAMLPPAMSISAEENFRLSKSFSETDSLSEKSF